MLKVSVATENMQRNPNKIYTMINLRYKVLRIRTPLCFAGFGEYLWGWLREYMSLYLELIADSPDGGKPPRAVVLDLLPQTLDVDVDGTRIADVFITPDLV